MITLREYWGGHTPINGDTRVVPRNTKFVIGVVVLIDLVTHRAVTHSAEAVTHARRDVDAIVTMRAIGLHS